MHLVTYNALLVVLAFSHKHLDLAFSAFLACHGVLYNRLHGLFLSLLEMSAGGVDSPCDPDDVVNGLACFDGDLPRYRYRNRNRNQRTLILSCSHRQVEVYDIYSTLSYNQFSHYSHERFPIW